MKIIREREEKRLELATYKMPKTLSDTNQEKQVLKTYETKLEQSPKKYILKKLSLKHH